MILLFLVLFFNFTIFASMIEIRAGTFEMGNTRNDQEGWLDEYPVHEVSITYDYEIGKYEVTNLQFLGFLNDAHVSRDGFLNVYKIIDMGNQNCEFEYEAGYFRLKPKYKGKENYPVILVTWWGAIEYCNWLSKENGLDKAYKDDGSLVDYPDNNGYRLPTEAEWEYAAQGGNSSLTDYRYAGSNRIDEVAWHFGNSKNNEFPIWEGRGTHPTGKKAANEKGIFDMSGNLSEWCYDWYTIYPDTAQINPIKDNPEYFSSRITRGGDWGYFEDLCRPVSRDKAEPDVGSILVGFRIVRSK